MDHTVDEDREIAKFWINELSKTVYNITKLNEEDSLDDAYYGRTAENSAYSLKCGYYEIVRRLDTIIERLLPDN